MINTYFDRSAMSDPAISFYKEYLLTSEKGIYAASTISGCNTRKYHGLLIAPQAGIDNENYVLLSCVDETVVCNGISYSLGVHQYPGVIHPEGYKNISDFFGNPLPKWIYQLNNITIIKEILLPEAEDFVFIRYTLAESKAEIKLNLAPFLAFRNIHQLSKCNIELNKKTAKVSNGIKCKLYEGLADLYIQTSTPSEFVHAPDWYYNIEYPAERVRGYDYREDLFVPGYFNLKMEKGDQVIFYAGLREGNPKNFKPRFTNQLKKKPVLNNIDECLEHAAKQFIIKKDIDTKVKAGYYWFDTWGRDSFISLPGLTLPHKHYKTFKAVVKSELKGFKKGLFPNVSNGEKNAYNSVDAPLWFVWAIQQYAYYTATETTVWKDYRKQLMSILDNYKNGTLFSIRMDNDGLITAGEKGMALTWMDAIVEGVPVTPRVGKTVEVNALWYNAICFCLKVALYEGDEEFIKEWENYPEKIEASFIARFTSEDKPYIADYINGEYTDWSIRPNQIFALSLPYSMVPEAMRTEILNTVKTELLTSRGLRTLSVNDPQYVGKYHGDQRSRDRAYHQGTIWPWLLGHFAEAYIKEHNEEGVSLIRQLYGDFENALQEQCLYSISEVYDGDEPHNAGGAVSQAWSVAELLRIKDMVTEYAGKTHTKVEG
jgi:predicted glycogen debranching enzyme